MATFTATPTYSINLTVTPRILKTEFSDAYSQRAGDGLNTQRQIWGLEFIGSISDIDVIETFLLDTGGYESFDWTPPRQESALKFIYTSYSRSPAGPTTDKLNSTFRQEFDLT